MDQNNILQVGDLVRYRSGRGVVIGYPACADWRYQVVVANEEGTKTLPVLNCIWSGKSDVKLGTRLRKRNLPFEDLKP